MEGGSLGVGEEELAATSASYHSLKGVTRNLLRSSGAVGTVTSQRGAGEGDIRGEGEAWPWNFLIGGAHSHQLSNL